MSSGKWLKNFLINRGYRLSKTTDIDRLKNFLRAVYPLATEHPLIRIGSAGDGGYLVPNDLEGISTCFSPGVSETADFEGDLVKRGIRCFLADYSVDASPVSHELITFEKKYLGARNTDIFMTLDSWVDSKDPSTDDKILQMDIEGHEYDVLLTAKNETLNKFRIIVLEIHNIKSILDPHGFHLIELTFIKLLNNFDIVHIHPNNYQPPLQYRGLELPNVMEFTLLRKDRSKHRRHATQFPHPLDVANVPSQPDYPLPSCWHLRA